LELLLKLSGIFSIESFVHPVVPKVRTALLPLWCPLWTMLLWLPCIRVVCHISVALKPGTTLLEIEWFHIITIIFCLNCTSLDFVFVHADVQ